MSFDKLLAELQEEYLSTIPEKAQAIETHFKNNDSEMLVEVFHKLKGTGRTHGVPELSQLGEVFEFVCKKQKSKLEWAVPTALTLLTKIHEARAKKLEFDIASDRDFQAAKELLN